MLIRSDGSIHRAQETVLLRPVSFLLLAVLFCTGPVHAQESIFTKLLSSSPPDHALWADHSSDSSGTTISMDLSGTPLYHEWNDSLQFQQYYGARGHARLEHIHQQWKVGLAYSYQTFRVLSRPVSYQRLQTRLDHSRTSISLSRSLPGNFLTATSLGYNHATHALDYSGGVQWLGFSWMQPLVLHRRYTNTHHTRFELYDSGIEFRDFFATEKTTIALRSSRKKRTGYALQYTTGTLWQPADIQTGGETQSTSLNLSEWKINLRVPFFMNTLLMGGFSEHKYDGDSDWYTGRTQFADLTRLSFREKIVTAGLRWDRFEYTFQHEVVEHSIYGQVRSVPFSGQALDLLGTTFAANSKGSLRIRSHAIAVQSPISTGLSYRGELAYTTITLNRLDYRTYVLIWGFPRQETLRISDTNVRRTHFLRLFLQFPVRITSRIACLPTIQQYVPVHTEYVEELPPGEGFTKPGRSYFGGNRFSLRFEYDL